MKNNKHSTYINKLAAKYYKMKNQRIYENRREKFVIEFKNTQNENLKKNIKIAILYTDICWILFLELVKSTQNSVDKLSESEDEFINLKDEYLFEVGKIDKKNYYTSDESFNFENNSAKAELEEFDKKVLNIIDDNIKTLKSVNEEFILADIQLFNYATDDLFKRILIKDSFDEWESKIFEGLKFLANFTTYGSFVAFFELINNVKNERIQRIKIVDAYSQFFKDYMDNTYTWSIFSAMRILQLNKKDNNHKIDINNGINFVNHLEDKLFQNLKI